MHNQDFELMPSTQQVIIQSPTPPVADSAPGEEGEFVSLDENLVMDTYNLSYDELQKKIVQACKKNFPDDLASPAFIRESVIVTNTRKNPNAIVITNLAFIGAEKSNIEYLMAKNKKLAKKLQATRQEVEHLYAVAQNASFTQVHLKEMKATILGDKSTLGDIIENLYEEHVTMHKDIVHMHGLQQKCKDIVKMLRNVKSTIVFMHEWSIQYKMAPLQLGKKTSNTKSWRKQEFGC